MYQLKLLVAMGALVASIGVGSLTGCKSTEEHVTYPDGTVYWRKDVEVKPNFFPSLLNYEMQEKGFSREGLRLRQWTPKNGGEIIHEAGGIYYVPIKPVKPEPISYLIVENQVDEEIADDFQSTEYRISADYFADTGVLEGQIANTNNWQVIVSGDLETVAVAAMRRGLGVMEFTNEFGDWSIHVDAPLPVIVTRLNGDIINVHGVSASHKPKLEMHINESCR